MGSKGVKWASPVVFSKVKEEKSMWAPTVVFGPSNRLPMTAPSHLTMAQFTMAQFTMAPISMAPTAACKRQRTFINMADQVEQKKRKLPDPIGNTKAKHTVLNSVETSHGTVLVVDDASAHTQRNIPAQQPVHQPAPAERSLAASPTPTCSTPPPCPPTPEKDESPPTPDKDRSTMKAVVPTLGGPWSLSEWDQAAQSTLPCVRQWFLHQKQHLHGAAAVLHGFTAASTTSR